jgi:hypothetical protein
LHYKENQFIFGYFLAILAFFLAGLILAEIKKKCAKDFLTLSFSKEADNLNAFIFKKKLYLHEL